MKPKIRNVLIALGVTACLTLLHLALSSTYERPVTFERPIDLNRQDCRIGIISVENDPVAGDVGDVAIRHASASESVARKAMPRAQIVPFDDVEDAFVALLSGNIEGFVYGEHVLNLGLRAYPNRFKILDQSLGSTPSVVLLSPQRGDLLAEVNKFIANTRQLGVYDDMVARWYQNDRYEGMPSIPEADGSRGILLIGTSGEEEPSSFYDDEGTLTGFDIEFARRFAQMMGLKPVIECRPSRYILHDLHEGRLDMVIDNYTVAEAMPGLRSSDSYFDGEMKVLVRSGDESTMMLGSTRLGYSHRLISDPRIGIFLTGLLTSVSLVFVVIAAALAAAFGLRALEPRLGTQKRKLVARIARSIRVLPPPIIVLFLCCFGLGGALIWIAVVLTLALWFTATLEPVLLARSQVILTAVNERLIDLVQWTTLVGMFSICDLAFAVDLVCGRNLKAVCPLISVGAAYWLICRLIQYACTKIGTRLK